MLDVVQKGTLHERKKVRIMPLRRVPCNVWARFFVFVTIFTVIFSLVPSAVDWIFLLRRTELQAIEVEVHPDFTQVHLDNTSVVYGRLWRHHELNSDSCPPRHPGFIAVPILYVPGNAGSFEDMRWFGRHIGEANTNQRRRHAMDFEENVKRFLFHFYKNEGLDFPADGDKIPQHLVEKAEEAVIAETPLLGIKAYGVDFLDEAFFQSGVLMVKEAQFLNFTVHFVMQELMNHYNEVLSHYEMNIRRSRDERVLLPGSVKTAEDDYIESICNMEEGKVTKEVLACENAKKHIITFSSIERLRRELKRVQSEGIWVWTESFGGAVAVFATLMAPHMYAGLVMAGAPLRFSPFFYDSSCVDFQRVVHDAVVVSHTQQNILKSTFNWSKVFAVTKSIELLRNFRVVPSLEVAARVRHVNFVSVHGGSLDDIVPSRSSLILRSTGRSAPSVAHRKRLRVPPPYAGRRDLSTEELRDCGLAITHRGLVYASQLLNVAAESLVRAALSSNSSQLVGPESILPPTKKRLFPTVVETLFREHDAHRIEEFFFMASLNKINGGDGYRKGNLPHALKKMRSVCVDSTNLLDMQVLPAEEEEDVESWKPLHLFIGVTTYNPDEVHLPELRLIGANGDTPEEYVDVYSRAATKLYLPTHGRNENISEKHVLRTAISFQILRKSPLTTPTWVRPRFCFYVHIGKSSEHHSYVLHDRIDPMRETETADVHRLTVALQMSGDITVEKFGRFALVRNLQSTSMETNMMVQVKNREIFPHVICGSFRSFRVLFRGTKGLAPDEPESQQQHFYGPYEARRNAFYYSWRPFHITPFNLTNIYLIYVLAADEQPVIHLNDLELYQSHSWGDFQYWSRRFASWKMSWMTMLSSYSNATRYVSCYFLFSFTFYISFRMPHFAGERLALQAPFRLRNVNRFFLLSVLSFFVEPLISNLARNALTLCLQDEPPNLSDEELTSMMCFREKLTLILFYFLPPRYDACKYPWIRMQTVLPRDVQTWHILNLFCSFSMGSLVLLLGSLLRCLVWPVSLLLRSLMYSLTDRLLLWFLAIMWCVPAVVHATFPWIHVCVTTTLSCLMSLTVIGSIPDLVMVVNAPRYRHICFLLTVVLFLTAHLEGFAPVIRNYIFITSLLLNDYERFETLPEHLFVFTMSQICLVVVYSTVYLTIRHHRTIALAHATKKHVESNGSVWKIGKETTKVCDNHRSLYILGDISRRNPRLMRLATTGSCLMIFAAHWITVVALRRPMEGIISNFGFCAIAMHIALVLVQLW